MKNHVTFEAAVRLKAAGFPQPEPEFGQVWHIMWSDWQAGIVGFCDNRPHGGGLVYVAISGEPAKTYYPKSFENFFFAPTAADILQHLPGLSIGYYPIAKEMDWASGSWSVFDDTGTGSVSEHDNPAEAAALAWLSINEKKQEQ